MKRDIKYVIKRILIGVGIALILGVVRGYALEDPLAGNNTTLIDKYNITSIQIKDYYSNWQSVNGTYQYTLPSSTDYSGCQGQVYTDSFNSINDYTIPGRPDSSYLNANWSCYDYSKKYTTLAGINVNIQYPFEKDKYYKINLWYMKDKEGMRLRAPFNNNSFMADPSNINITHDNTIEDYGGSYGSYSFLDGPYNQSEDSEWYNWLGISYIFKVLENTSQLDLWYGYNPNSTLISGNETYPSTFTTNTITPLVLYNNSYYGNGSNALMARLTHTRPFIYEYVVENPSIQIPDFSSMAEDTLSDINDDITSGIENGTYTTQNELDAFSGGGGGAGIAFGSNNISDILIVPLRFMQKFNSDTTCEPLEIPLPKLNSNIALPCMSAFYTTFLGSDIFNIVQLIIGVGLGFKICMAFYYTIIDILDPQKLIVD